MTDYSLYRKSTKKVQKILRFCIGNGETVNSVHFSGRVYKRGYTHTRTPLLTNFLVFIIYIIPLYTLDLRQNVQFVQFPHGHIKKRHFFPESFCTFCTF